MTCSPPPYEFPTRPTCNIPMIELVDSRKMEGTTTGESWELHFYLQGSLLHSDIVRRMFDPQIGVPLQWEGQPYFGHTLTPIGPGHWDLIVIYRYAGASEYSQAAMPFSLAASPYPTHVSYGNMGGNIKLTQGFSTRKYPSTAPDVEDAIEWDGEKVNGHSVPAVQRQYSETWLFNRESIYGNGDLLTKWDELANTIHGTDRNDNLTDEEEKESFPENERTFRNWGHREVLFKGVQIRQADVDVFEVTFEFEIRKHEIIPLPLSIKLAPNESDELDHDPWDEIWFKYGKTDVQNAQNGEYFVVPRAQMAVASQVRRYSNFKELGIGLARLPGYSLSSHSRMRWMTQDKDMSTPRWEAPVCQPSLPAPA